MASNTSKCIPKHPPHPKTSFGSPHTLQEYLKKNSKIGFGLEIAFFKLEGSSGLKKRAFEQFFAFKIFLQTLFHDPPRQKAKLYVFGCGGCLGMHLEPLEAIQSNFSKNKNFEFFRFFQAKSEGFPSLFECFLSMQMVKMTFFKK